MEKSLDELLSDEPADTAEPVIDTSDHVTTTLDQPRDESGRFAPKETGVEPQETAEPVPPTADKLPPDTFKGLKEEREKRQSLERELEALRKHIEAQQNPPAPPPTIWDDEQAALTHVKNEAVATAVQQATLNARLDMSEMMTRQANPDFEDMKARFLQMAEMNPVLRQQALEDPNPWNRAYQIAKNAATMEQLGATDLDTLKAKLREELMAEMQVNPAPRQNVVPQSLTNERNVGSRSGPAWSGPKSLSELLG